MTWQRSLKGAWVSAAVLGIGMGVSLVAGMPLLYTEGDGSVVTINPGGPMIPASPIVTLTTPSGGFQVGGGPIPTLPNNYINPEVQSSLDVIAAMYGTSPPPAKIKAIATTPIIIGPYPTGNGNSGNSNNGNNGNGNTGNNNGNNNNNNGNNNNNNNNNNDNNNNGLDISVNLDLNLR
jgi:hypothetical protein